jgi:hypothetical protein
MDTIPLYGCVTLLHSDTQQRDIALVVLRTGFWAAAQVNVDRAIEANLPREAVGEFEGMAGRIGSGRAAACVPGACHQRTPGMCR